MHLVYKINPVFWRILLRVFVLVFSHRLHVRLYCMYIGRDHTSFIRRSVSYTSVWRCRSVRTCYLHNNTTPRKFCLLQFRFVSHADKNVFSSDVNGQVSPDQITIIPFRLYSRKRLHLFISWVSSNVLSMPVRIQSLGWKINSRQINM